ncbi:MAG: hypothetical protein MJ078_04260, partial [Clostridia bacterium]|nr:hypothetical protein [Clostridia bacterium]
YFAGWENADPLSDVTTDSISADASFQPFYGLTDGTIPKVAQGAIKVDGAADEAYGKGTEHAAMIPIGAFRQADDKKTPGSPNAPTDYTQTTRKTPDENVGKSMGYAAWDGEYIYIMVEVYDGSLTARSSFYVNAVANSYLNDTVEFFYSCEQVAAANGQNQTKVGVTACKVGSAPKKFSMKLGSNINGGRSTWFEEIECATHTYLHNLDDITLGGPETDLPNYRVEIKIPARTEGVAADGCNELTGLKDGADEGSNDPDDYAFTGGEALEAGSFFRISLQVNDLQHDLASLLDGASACHEDQSALAALTEANPNYAGYALFDASGAEVLAEDIRFSAVGRTQYDLKYYITFSLGAAPEDGMTTIYSFDNNGEGLDKDGTIVKEFSKIE